MAVLEHVEKGGGGALSNVATGKGFCVKRRVDCAQNNVAASDVVKLLEVPQDILVEEVIMNVKTVEGATLGVDVGDFARSDDSEKDSDRFLDSADTNGNALGSHRTEEAASGDVIPEGKFYADESAYIGATFANAADAAVIDFFIIGKRCA